MPKNANQSAQEHLKSRLSPIFLPMTRFSTKTLVFCGLLDTLGYWHESITKKLANYRRKMDQNMKF